MSTPVTLAFLFMLVLIVALAAMFVAHARAIRRDIDERFDRLQQDLEEEAKLLVKDLLDENKS